MWGGTQPDPGGENPSEAPVSNQELKDLKDQFDQQQVLIAQLKEMLRKSEQTAVMQEKVEEYANTLTRMNAKVKKSKSKRAPDVTDSGISVDTPAKEKILLLRQQMEENKLRLAERGKLHKGIEETVSQLKAQFDDSQHIMSQASLNLSLIDPKDESYSINSSPEELFNYLAIKDRRICDLNAKIQKLEASVLDLQENVKEKDSVIDARTKAITLMTESLSKKGKNTLDALDDTKEQMRKMQENFINLEAQMKSEKQLLIEQLDVKNTETDRLEKLCDELQQRLKNEPSPKKGRKGKKGPKSQKSTDESNTEQNECDTHLSKLAEYETTITELNLTIEELKVLQTKAKETESSENVEVAKLKKQLEEHNKTMIKTKAQHKSKLKELNKTIDELKKSRDGALEIKQLQEQNAKLSEQVSKLSSTNDLVASEQVNDLEMKLLEQSELVESKNQTISTLEEQIMLYKTQVEQLERFSRLENDQVVSEIQSIDFEEQLDKVQMEKMELAQKFDEIIAEKATLLETIDNLTKEKQEISSKLDNYIQENMELIDKLEKLSSAKVSSAESIEIVEGLTQQEKLELEEYQKGLEIPENIKSSAENLESSGLNESVNQLTEETSDLLRKIELFTEERREVMDKMEALTMENTQLNMKICQVENNRDVLAETYEQVQNEKEDLEAKLDHEKQRVKELETSLLEKIAALQDENTVLKAKIEMEGSYESEIGKDKKESSQPQTSVSNLQSQIDEYKALIEIQAQEIRELKLELLANQNLPLAYSNLQEEINLLQSHYHTLQFENEILAKSVKENSELIHEKHSQEAELVETRKRISNFSEKLSENLEEIENYKSILEENKNELISSANIINELQNKVQTKQNEIQHYEAETERLNSIITDLTLRVTNIENENAQNFDNIETMEIMSNQLQELKEILNENIKQIEKYEEEIQTNTDTIGQLTLELKELKTKLDNMQQDIESKNQEIVKLAEEKDSNKSLIAKLRSELKEKDQSFHEACEKLKQKCVGLQNKIDENTGTFDKLDLPKLQELESKNKEQLEKMKKIAASLKKKNSAYQELEKKCTQLDNNCQALNKDAILKDQEIEQLKAEIIHLRSVTKEAELQGSNECNDLNLEISQKNNLIKTLTTELEGLRYNSETNANALQVKIQELEMFIETQDSELNKYKEQVNRLEEGLSALEERRQSLERQAVELGNQLEQKSNSYEEISQIEDILEQRLATLMAQDKKMEKRLQDSTIENQTLQENNKYLIEENDKLKQKLAHAIERNVDANKVVDMEHEIQHLKEIVSKTESDYKRHCAEHEKKLIDKSIEVENLEIELQGQLIQLNNERKLLIVHCEQLNDQIKEHLDTQEALRESIEDYKSKLNQQQNDFDTHMEKCQKLSEEYNSNLIQVDQLHAQIENHMSEITHLSNSLSEKNADIENCQQQIKELESSNQNLQEQYILTSQRLNEFQVINSELQEKVTQANTESAIKTISPTTVPVQETIPTFVWTYPTSNDPFDSVVASQSYQSAPPQPPQHDEPTISSYFEAYPVERAESNTFQNTESQTLTSDHQKVSHNIDTQTIEKTFRNSETITETDNLQSIQGTIQTNDDYTNDQLVNKIKTLEFMLFNAEKEKEDALYHCQELTGQIAQLIYDKQEYVHDETKTQERFQGLEVTPSVGMERIAIDDQIVSTEDAQVSQGDLQELQCIEFEKCDQHKNEDIIEPKSAYLCYPCDSKTTIESQIVKPEDATITKENLQRLQNVEFTKCKEPKDVAPQTVPVSETTEAKSAYLCFKSDDIFDENDDGWGCGSDEAKLDDDYHQQQQQVDQQITHISELNARVCSLEAECAKHCEENKQSQIKSGKLLKKLKEYKALNDKLEAELRKSDEFSGLDDALQEEFKTQITQLEKRVKEVTLDLEKERSYKNNLSKQLDVLHAANERMVELKEKQDFEMLTWQRQNRELSSKLEQFEWGDGDSESPKHEQRPSDDRVNELTAVINELTKDNDELQVLLEEQRNLRLTAEKSKIDGIREEEYLRIVADKDSLKDELSTILEEKKMLHNQLNNSIQLNDELQEKHESILCEKIALESQIVDKSKYLTELTEEVENLKLKVSESESNKHSIENLHAENASLTEHKRDLEQKLVKLNECEIQLASYEQQLSEITHQLHTKSDEVLVLTEKLEAALQEKSALTESIQLLNEDWSQRVDQRGADIAESWKLHLETCESEFTQTEQNLKREINDLEEKCNALVNENNELRKNVDADIRNEIDKMSALQQQINDRQLYINDLSRVIQEKQTEAEQQQLRINECESVMKQITQENDLLKLEITEKLQTINELENKLLAFSDIQNKLQNQNELLAQLQLKLKENEKLIDENIIKLNQSNKELEEYREAAALFQQQMESKDQYISELARNVHENQTQINTLNKELKTKSNTIQQLEMSQTNQDEINKTASELSDLKMLLQKKEEELTAATLESERLLNTKLQELEDTKTSEVIQILSAKDSDLEKMRLELSNINESNNTLTNEYHRLEGIVNDLNLKLEDKINECEELGKKIYEQDLLQNEENKQVSELGAIIEDQVFRIEALKQELYEKSKDYDSLIAELDIRKPSLEEHAPLTPKILKDSQVQQSDVTPTNLHASRDDDSLEPVNRAELDLALYMLHQRDVRCEELTVELIQLLEERDTLQLKLSNAIREREDMRKYLPAHSEAQPQDTEDMDTSNVQSSPSKVSAIVLGASGTEIATEAIEGTGPLANKLLELKRVGYGRDKTILDEQERRRFQQLALMQEHRDVASLLPPEAAAKLVQDANYTLSRDVQSPSKVLLDWLWGRSTPKVNNV